MVPAVTVTMTLPVCLLVETFRITGCIGLDCETKPVATNDSREAVMIYLVLLCFQRQEYSCEAKWRVTFFTEMSNANWRSEQPLGKG